MQINEVREGYKEGQNIMNFKNLYLTRCILICLIFLGCGSKNKNLSELPQETQKTSEQFFKAIALLDTETVSDYLNNRFDANTRRDDKTALMLAIITPYFLPSQEDKARVSSGQSTKENIVNERRKQIIQSLINKGASINATDENNKTALLLTITITGRSFDYRKELLGIEIKTSDGQKISDPNSRYHGLDIWTTHITETSTFQISQILIEAGADVNIADRYGRVPLTSVIHRFFNMTPFVQMLIDAGANVDATDENGNTVLIQALMEIEKTDDSIRQALLEELVEIIIEADADMSVTNKNGRTLLIQLLEMAQQKFIHNIVEMVDLLIKVEADVNIKNERDGHYRGWTPLMLACSLPPSQSHPEYKLDIVKILLKAEADPKARNDQNWTVLMIASANLNPNDPASEDIVEELLKNGANPNIINYLWTPLMFASRSGSVNAVRTLIEYEAETDILLQTYTGQGPRSPFICARYAPKNQSEIEDLLIENGASIRASLSGAETGVCDNDSYMQF